MASSVGQQNVAAPARQFKGLTSVRGSGDRMRWRAQVGWHRWGVWGTMPEGGRADCDFLGAGHVRASLSRLSAHRFVPAACIIGWAGRACWRARHTCPLVDSSAQFPIVQRWVRSTLSAAPTAPPQISYQSRTWALGECEEQCAVACCEGFTFCVMPSEFDLAIGRVCSTRQMVPCTALRPSVPGSSAFFM
jgi:hypothetical protein